MKTTKSKVESMSESRAGMGKRSLDKDLTLPDEDESLPAKKMKEDLDKSFTEVQFKFLLRDEKTVDEGLSKFVQSAETYEEGSSHCDIVARFCQTSNECTELLNLLDITKQPKPYLVTLVFSCLEHILIRIRQDISKYSSFGDALVQRLLAGHMTHIYNGLRDQNKSNAIKASLKLLISMVMLSDKAKKAVQTRLNFEHATFPVLFQRRNRKDPQDVRSCMVLLTLAFILEGEHSIVETLVQQKTFLQMTISGLKYDSKDVVVDVLATLLDKVLRCPVVSKTAKIKVFSETVLRQLCDLYTWQGPTRWRVGAKKVKDFEEEEMSPEVLEGREVVSEVTHEFLVELCCSHKHGIIFVDKAIGTGPRNLNQLISHFLESLATKLDHSLKADLVIRILCACPDQIAHFLPHLSSVLSPRWSDKWAARMDFVMRVYKGLADKPSFVTDHGVPQDQVFVPQAVVFCLLPTKVAPILVQAVKHDDLRVRHKGLQLLRVLLQKASCILKSLKASELKETVHKAVTESSSEMFTSSVLKALPSVNCLHTCVDKFTHTVAQSNKGKTQFSDTELTDHAIAVLQVLNLYQCFLPMLFSEQPKELAKLIEMVDKLSGSGQREPEAGQSTDQVDSLKEKKKQKWLPQLCLLKILSETDARKISLGRENLLEKLLMSASHNDHHRELTVHLICKMLESLETFSDHARELSIWLNEALPKTSTLENEDENTVFSSQSSVMFLSRCLTTMVNNPTPYMDRLNEIFSETEMLTNEDEKQVTHVSHSPKKKNDFDAILQMEHAALDLLVEQTEIKLGSSKSCSPPFSPLILVALDNLQFNKTADAVMRDYVSRVLLRLLHIQSDPAYFCAVVQRSEAVLSLGVKEYIQFWSSSQHEPLEPEAKLSVLISGQFSFSLIQQFFKEKDEDDENKEEVVSRLVSVFNELSSEEKLIGLGQTLLYLSKLTHRCHKVLLSKQRKEQLELFCHVAEKLFEILLSPLKQVKDATSKKDDQQKQTVKDDNSEEGEEDDREDEDTRSFVEFLSSNFSLEQRLIETVKKVLSHPKLWHLFFRVEENSNVKGKSPKKDRKTSWDQSASYQISCFLCKVLIFCQRSEAVQKALTNDCFNMIFEKVSSLQVLPPAFKRLCLETLELLTSHLELPQLSHCVSRFTALASPIFVHEPESIDVVENEGMSLTATGMTFVKIIYSWITKIGHHCKQREQLLSETLAALGDDHGKITKILEVFSGNGVSDLITSKCIPMYSILSLAANHPLVRDLFKAQQAFDFEQETGCTISDLSVIFELLWKCQDPFLEQCVVSLLKTIPKAFQACSESLLRHLISSVSSLSDTRRQILEFLLRLGNKDFCSLLLMEQVDKMRRKKNKIWWPACAFLQNQSEATKPNNIAAAMESLKNVICDSVKQMLKAQDVDGLKALTLLCAAVGNADIEFLQRTLKSVTDFMEQTEDCEKRHYEVLQGASKFLSIMSEENSLSNSCLLLCLKDLSLLTSKKSKRNGEFEEYLLDFAHDLLSRSKIWSLDLLSSLWKQLVCNTLRYLYYNHKLLRLLARLVPLAYSNRALVPDLSVSVMFEMCISHTQFMTLMMSTEQPEVKGSLVQLLHTLCEFEPACCSTKLVNVLAGAYSARLSCTDQRLLCMLYKCSTQADKSFECPLLWGPAAVEHLSVSQALGPSLDKQASVKAVLDQLDPECLTKSLLDFPVRRSVNSLQIEDAEVYKSRPECYDPSFLLKLFCQILSPDKLVPVRQFVERGCLSYLLIALSSHHMATRLLAYQALNDFYVHLEGSRCHEKLELTFVLDLLNASRDKDGQKLPYVIALFFSRVVKLMLYPGDHMYVAIFRFLMAKPEIDLSHIPEFYKLFFSASTQHKQERLWMLSLLSDGMKETLDYRLYQKRYIFKIILCFYDSALSDSSSQALVLTTLRNACREKIAAVDLVKNYGLLSWLRAVVNKLPDHTEHTSIVTELLVSLWRSLNASFKVSGGKTKTKPLSVSKTKISSKSAVGEDNVDHTEDVDMVESDIDEDPKKQPEVVDPSSSPVLVPKSTQVEIQLVLKALLWHVSSPVFSPSWNLSQVLELIAEVCKD